MTVTARRGADRGLTMPKPGSFGLSRIGGLLGKLIAAGQAFSGDGSRFTHAFIVIDSEYVLEAMPGGARFGKLADRLVDPEVVFCDRPVQDWLAARKEEGVAGEELTDAEAYWGYVERLKRGDIVTIARPLEKVRYGYLQYLYLGLLALGRDSKWLRARISQRGSMICSQLVDEVFRRAGIQLFDDDRLPQEVTPGDLANRFGIA